MWFNAHSRIWFDKMHWYCLASGCKSLLDINDIFISLTKKPLKTTETLWCWNISFFEVKINTSMRWLNKVDFNLFNNLSPPSKKCSSHLLRPFCMLTIVYSTTCCIYFRLCATTIAWIIFDCLKNMGGQQKYFLVGFGPILRIELTI